MNRIESEKFNQEISAGATKTEKEWILIGIISVQYN